MNNYNLNYNNPEYPNIDHKISIKYGYLNDISVDEISSLNNLCITKKRINSDKRHMTEKEYKNYDFNIENTSELKFDLPFNTSISDKNT